MSNETLGKKNFQSLINQVYQQTAPLVSIENHQNRLAFLNSVKNFESGYVYNWQRFIYPIFNGNTTSPYFKYSGFRSRPWAEYDVLDPVYGGASGWTLTAEPWATENGLPCLWDGTRGQPNSITGALYCLSARIDAIINDKFDFTPYDDTEIRGLIHCNTLNLETLYKDIYACDLKANCSGENKLQYSFQRHLFEIFDQIISGGPDLSGDFSCEDEYPELFINISSCDISWDPSCPLVEISGAILDANTGLDAVINLENNGSPYDNINVVGQGGTAVYWDSAANSIIIRSAKGGTGEDWKLTSTASFHNPLAVDLNLTGQTTGNTSTVQIEAGAGTFITTNMNKIIISSMIYSNEVSSITGGVSFDLLRGGVSVDTTNIIGAGSVVVSRVSDSEILIEGNKNIKGSVDSDSMLGQKGIIPIRAIDYYANGQCCFYEYIHDIVVPAEQDLGLGLYDSTRLSTGDPYSIIAQPHVDTNGNREYSFDAVSTGGNGMAISFWCIKEYQDWVPNNSQQVVYKIYDSNTSTLIFQLFFDYPKNQILDPQHGNIVVSQGERMNEHLCLYALTGQGYFHKLIDITEEQLHNVWRHYTINCSLDFTGPAIDFYVDGALFTSMHTILITHSSFSGLMNFNSYSLFGPEVTPSRNFNGALEDFVLYDQLLTPTEITAVFGSREPKDAVSPDNWVNGKICEWWKLGEESQFSSYSAGQHISAPFSLISQVKGYVIGSNTAIRVGAEMVSNSTNYSFEFVNHVHVPSYSTLAGTPSVAVSRINLLSPAVTNDGWTITLIKVIEDTANQNIYHEQVVLEASSNSAYHLTQDPFTLNYYFYTDVTLEDCARNIEDVINTYLSSDFSANVPGVATYVDLESVGMGQRFNTPISGSGINVYFEAVPFTGGQASSTECVSPDGMFRAAGLIQAIYNPVDDHIAENCTFTITSTLGATIMYQAISTSNNPNNYASGDVVNNTGPFPIIAVLNADDLTETDPIFQSKKRLWKFMTNFQDAVNSPNGHNQGVGGSAITVLPQTSMSGINISLTQTTGGSAGNTPIVFSSAPGTCPVNITNFNGGTDSAGGIPANLEQYSQEAFFNSWPCTRRSIDLVPGNRFDITLTGYNTFTDFGTPPCMSEPAQVRNEYADDVLQAIVSSAVGLGIGTSQTGIPQNYIRSMSETQGLDVAGVGIVIKPAASCIEDARNIFFSTNYRNHPDYIENLVAKPDPNKNFPASDAARVWNRASKSLLLSKHSFRSFLAKWKMNLSITVGPSSEGDSSKVNLYYKGEGVEIDLYEKLLDGYNDYKFEHFNPGGGPTLSLEEKVKVSNLLLSRETGRHVFDIDHYNPFRHQYYSQWRMEDIYSMAVEDLSKKIEGNVIENVPVASSQATFLIPERRYYAYGTVTSANANLPFTVGDQGFFATIYGTNHLGNMLEFELAEFPGVTFYITSQSAASCPRSWFGFHFWLQMQNMFLQATINDRIWAVPPDCSVPAYDTIEAVVWGADSGVFKNSGALALLQGLENTYYPPDGQVDMMCWLEEFTIKEFEGQSLCDFEALNSLSSADQHWSGGPYDASCGTCSEWLIAGPTDLRVYNSGGLLIIPENGVYVGVNTYGETASEDLTEGHCDYDYCLFDIISDTYLDYTSTTGYGYVFDVTAQEVQSNTVQNAPSATWVPSSDFNTDEFFLHLIADPTTMTQQVTNSAIKVLKWTDQQNGFELTPMSGALDGAPTEYAPYWNASNSIGYVEFDHTLHQALSAVFTPKMDLDDGVDNGFSMLAVVILPQTNLSTPIGDLTSSGASFDTSAHLLNIGRGGQMNLRRHLVSGNYLTEGRFQNNSNTITGDLTGVVGTNQMFIVEYVFGQSGVTGAVKGVFVDGVLHSTASNPSGVTNFDFADSPRLRIGRKPDYSAPPVPSLYYDNSFSNFRLVEMLAFHRELLNTEREKVEGYLAHKYGIQTNLPSSHPYYSNAPS